MHRGISVHVPSSWQRGTLFLPLLHTTLQNDPGNASEQYPGNPGHVVRAEMVDDVNHRLEATNPAARDIVSS